MAGGGFDGSDTWQGVILSRSNHVVEAVFCNMESTICGKCTSIPLVLWTEERAGVGFLDWHNFNSCSEEALFPFSIINVCLWNWFGK